VVSKIFHLIVVLIITSASAWAGTTYYFDPGATAGTGAGTIGNPFFTAAQVNAKAFAVGDDLYFKVGTTYTLPTGQYFAIDWNGTSEDRVVIGAYYGENQFGLNGGSRPVLSGGEWLAPAQSSYNGIIHLARGSSTNTYVDIQYLELEKSGKYGFKAQYADQFTVKYCYTDKTWGNGIVIERCSDWEVYGNIVDNPRYSRIGAGAGIEITANDSIYYLTQRGLVKRNTVFGAYEGIGIYKRSRDIVVTENIVYDCYSFHLYVASSTKVVMSNNLVYDSKEFYEAGTTQYHLNACQEIAQNYCEAGKFIYYGNVSINARHGTNISSALQAQGKFPDCAQANFAVFNNTFIRPYHTDQAYTYRWWRTNQTGWEGYFKNNISYLSDGGAAHIDYASVPGVVWDNNLFSSAVTGNAAIGALIADPNIVQTSGWGDLTPGSLTLEDTVFRLAYGNSVDAGEHLTTISATEGTANNTMPVTEAAWFGRTMPVGVDANNDGSIDWTDEVVSVDYDNNVITLQNSHAYTANGKIWLARSLESTYAGANIDMGAFEYRDYPNTPPVISNVTPGSGTITNEQLTQVFDCDVTDAEGDAVTVTWDFVTSGAYGANYTGTTPGSLALIDPGTYPATRTVVITATDGPGLSTTFTLTFQIIDSEEPDPSTCQVSYDPAITANINTGVAQYNINIKGARYTSPANETICALTAYFRGENGSVTNNIAMRAYSLNASDEATAILGTSDVVPAASFSPGVWITFTFSTPFLNTSGTEIGFGWFGDNDGNLDDSPEYSGTNYPQLGYRNDTNIDAIQTGLINWTWSSSFPYAVGSTNDANDDVAFKVHTMQEAPVTVEVQDLIGVTPNGVYKAGETITVAVLLNIAYALTAGDTITGESGVGTDIVLTLSSAGSASTLHYFTGIVPAGAVTSDLTIIALDFDGLSLTIPAGHNLNDSADIAFDTTTPGIENIRLCNEDKTTITSGVTVTTPTTQYICLDSDGNNLFFANGTLSNLKITLTGEPATIAKYYDGIGTQTIQLEYTTVPGSRGSAIEAVSVNAFEHGTTTIQDQAGNEIDYTLPSVDLNTFGDINFLVPKNLSTGTGWIISTNWATDKPATIVSGDHFVILNASDTIAPGAINNLVFDLVNPVGTYNFTITGANNVILKRSSQTVNITGSPTVIESSPWMLVQ